jgi:predicted ATPase
MQKPEAELQSALGRLVSAGLLFRQGVPPYATYLFKHALVQDAAYGTLLREPRRTLHDRIAETLEDAFPDIAENQPEIVARHCTEAGQIEKASRLAARETTAALEQARLLIERTEALGEHSDNPLLLFRVLEGFWQASYVAFNGNALRERAAHFLALAEKQGAVIPLIMGHRQMGVSLVWTGDIVEGRVHLDRAVALYDDAKRPLATGTGKDFWILTLADRSLALWILGYPEAALTDAQRAVKDARDLNRHFGYAVSFTSRVFILRGDFAAANAQLDEAIAWANEKGSVFWKAMVMRTKGWLLVLTGKASDAVEMITSALAAYRSTGSTASLPFVLSHLATVYADLGHFDNAWRSIDEAMAAIKSTEETIYEAEVYRIAGQIALQSLERDTAKAEGYFERALAVARQQQAKSWELRAAMSLARLWRSQDKAQQARELLAPVYGWFTEGFDTRDLKEVKVLLEELAA